MTLRLKDASSVQKLFGLTKGFGGFANNEIIKNNPQLLSILVSKKTRVSFKKKSYINPKLLKLNTSAVKKPLVQTVRSQTRKVQANTIDTKPERSLDQVLDSKGFRSYQWRSDNSDRYYNIYLQPTLIGNYSVTKSWGSLHSHLGHYKTIIFDTLKDAELEIQKICTQRKYRGYTEVSIRTFY